MTRSSVLTPGTARASIEEQRRRVRQALVLAGAEGVTEILVVGRFLGTLGAAS